MPASTFVANRGKSVDVLLVEDNASDVRLVREAVAECDPPVRLTLAIDGEQALEILTSGFEPALIILDLNLPKISGLEVLEQYQSGRAPVVVFSSSCTEAEIYSALRLGASECVRKPSDLSEYVKTVRAMIDKWARVRTWGVSLHHVCRW